MLMREHVILNASRLWWKEMAFEEKYRFFRSLNSHSYIQPSSTILTISHSFLFTILRRNAMQFLLLTISMPLIRMCAQYKYMKEKKPNAYFRNRRTCANTHTHTQREKEKWALWSATQIASEQKSHKLKWRSVK